MPWATCENAAARPHSHIPPILRILIPLLPLPSARSSRVFIGFENRHQRKIPRFRKEFPAHGGTPHHHQERRRKDSPGRWPQGHRIAAQKEPSYGPRTRRRAHRSRHALFRTRHLRRPRNVRRVGRRSLRRNRHRPSPRFRPALHGHRQRRHGKSRRVFSDDRQKSNPRAKHRHRKSYPHDLSRRLGRRFSPASRRRFPRHRRLLPRFSQQRGYERHRYSANHRHHGYVRGWRRVSPGDVRPHPDDRRLRPLPRRPRAGASRNRPENLRRRFGRRQNAFANQWHGGFPRTRRRILPETNSRTGGQDGRSEFADLQPLPPQRAAVFHQRTLRHLLRQSRQAIRHARNHRSPSG